MKKNTIIFPLINCALTILLFCQFSCSKPGESPGQPVRKEKVEVEKKDGTQEKRKIVPHEFAGISLTAFQDGDLKIPGCPKQKPEYVLTAFSERNFSLDGNLNEWENLVAHINDPQGELADAPDLKDLRFAYLGTDRKDLLTAISLYPESGQENWRISVEFGTLVRSNGSNYALEVDRRYQLSPLGVMEFRDGEWFSLESRISELAENNDHSAIEWRIDRRQLDSVLSSGMWWARVTVGLDSSSDVRQDRSNVVFLKSEDPARRNEFSMSVCQEITNNHYSPEFTLITPGSTPKPSDLEEFDIIRAAYADISEQLVNPAVGISNVNVIVVPDAANLRTGSIAQSTIPDFEFAWFASADKFSKRFKAENYHEAARRVANFLLLTGSSGDPRNASADLYLTTEYTISQAFWQRFGFIEWLSFFNQATLRMWKLIDPSDRQGLEERFAKIHSGQVPDNAIADYENATSAKLLSFTWQFGRFIKREDLLKAWFAPGDSLYERLNLQTGAEELVSGLWQGWMTSGEYNNQYAPSTLNDDDSDGLPNFIESGLKTDPNAKDTDEDGWTDLAEYKLGKDPLSARSRPTTLIADGAFTDFQELNPASIQVTSAATANGHCPRNSRINAVGTLHTGPGILVSFVLAEPMLAEDFRSSWTLEISGLPGSGIVHAEAQAGDFGITIKQPSLTGGSGYISAPIKNIGKVIEWYIPRGWISALNADQFYAAKPKVRISSVYLNAKNEQDLCMATDWLILTKGKN